MPPVIGDVKSPQWEGCASECGEDRADQSWGAENEAKGNSAYEHRLEVN